MKKFWITSILVLVMGAWGVAQTHDSVKIVGTPQVRAQNNTAVISWQTDKNAATQVKYGTDPNNMSEKAYEAGGSTNHNVTLQNLEAGKTYYFAILDNDGQVRQRGQFVAGRQGTQQVGAMNSNMGESNSREANERNRESNERNRESSERDRQSGGPDNVVIVAGPVVQNLQPTQATLWWQTDDRAATHIKYGTDPNNLQQSAYEPGGDRNHSVQLTGLQPGQTVYYQVMRRDGSVRTQGQFMTPGQNMGMGGMQGNNQYVQITNGPVLEQVASNMAVVSWATAQPSSSVVRYGTDPNSLNQTAQAQWGTNHRVTISNLQPNTRYFFEIQSSQQPGSGQMTATNTGQFTTVGQGQSAWNTGAWERARQASQHKQ